MTETRFVQTLRVQFHDTDAMGVVHHANYVKYVERARVEFLRERGLSYRELTDSGIHLAVIEIQFKYLKPAKFDDVLLVEAWISKLRRASADFDFLIKRSEQVLCKGVTKLACVDQAAIPRAIPRQVLSALEQP